MFIVRYFLFVAVVCASPVQAQGLRLDEPQEIEATEREHSEALQGGYAALQGRDYDTAYNVFQTLALAGEPTAQYELGRLYHRGMGIAADAQRAAHWYARAAEQSHPEAQYRLGNMHMMGDGIAQNDSEAARWYTRALEQGHAGARENLAILKKIMRQAGD